jgi:cyclopropane-fatty-acyl-phospholipid synthase
VRNPAFFTKCLLYGDVGFGESYVDGDWDTPSIRDVIAWAILNTKNSPLAGGSKMGGSFNLLQLANRLAHLLRANTPRVSRRNIEAHYDLGNDFYHLWLDPTMTYSSALFSAPEQTLEAAQTAKYDRLCTQLRLKPSDRVLEIGCGWGGFAAHAARRYGCRVTGVTISPSQHGFANERMRREGLADQVSIELCDYRQLNGTYDKIVSIEMMEALGDRYLPVFCNAIDRLLAPEGLAALQFITVPDATHRELRRGVDFIQKHIFPGSLLLSVGRVNAALSNAGGFCLHHLEDLGASYARTLGGWWRTFNAQEPAVRALGFDARFMRKWNYYLQYCEAAFATRHISAVQVLYTRRNNLSLGTL